MQSRRQLERKVHIQQQALADLTEMLLGKRPLPTETKPEVVYVELGKERYRVRATITDGNKQTSIIQFHAGSLEDFTRKIGVEFRKLPTREQTRSIHIFMDRID